MTDWICALQAVAFGDNVSRQTIEEDNDLYCSSGDGKPTKNSFITSNKMIYMQFKIVEYMFNVNKNIMQII